MDQIIYEIFKVQSGYALEVWVSIVSPMSLHPIFIDFCKILECINGPCSLCTEKYCLRTLKRFSILTQLAYRANGNKL